MCVWGEKEEVEYFWGRERDYWEGEWFGGVGCAGEGRG